MAIIAMMSACENTSYPYCKFGREDDELTQKRTLALPSGQKIWDIAGNVLSWVDYLEPNGEPTPATDSCVKLTSLSSALTTTVHTLLPKSKDF